MMDVGDAREVRKWVDSASSGPLRSAARYWLSEMGKMGARAASAPRERPRTRKIAFAAVAVLSAVAAATLVGRRVIPAGIERRAPGPVHVHRVRLGSVLDLDTGRVESRQVEGADLVVSSVRPSDGAVLFTPLRGFKHRPWVREEPTRELCDAVAGEWSSEPFYVPPNSVTGACSRRKGGVPG